MKKSYLSPVCEVYKVGKLMMEIRSEENVITDSNSYNTSSQSILWEEDDDTETQE